MPYVAKWNDLPECEVLPNNFRKSIAGHKSGINLIRWVNPTKTPLHQHDDSEQIIIMLRGKIRMVIDEEEIFLENGDVCAIPISVPHYGEVVGEEAEFYEVFAPMRVQNLIGFLGKIF